jgi:hypothetical protein
VGTVTANHDPDLCRRCGQVIEPHDESWRGYLLGGFDCPGNTSGHQPSGERARAADRLMICGDPVAIAQVFPGRVLRVAVDVIRLEGWNQGGYIDEETGRVCAAGAIRIAAGGVAFESCRAALVAEKSFADYLTSNGLASTGQCPIEVIGVWNDAHGRTAADIAAHLLAAAEAALAS